MVQIFPFGFSLAAFLLTLPAGVISREDRVIWSPVDRASTTRDKACEMLIAIDEPLYRQYQRNMTELTRLVTDYVHQLNVIYQHTVLTGPFDDIYFRIKEVRVLFDFCNDCNQTQKVFLSEFSNLLGKQPSADFCLAHVFTYRDFPEGVQGLAWRGTICQHKLNTGFTTLLNHKVEASDANSVMTFAHEVGHNLGAAHDEEFADRPDCSVGDHIMGSSGTAKRAPTFSACSGGDISRTLSAAISREPLGRRKCFADVAEAEPDQISVCGNEVIEGDEECDCGLHYTECSDQCCYAAHISHGDLSSNASAQPCRRTGAAKIACLQPFRSSLIYGVIAPWIFIASVVAALAIGLRYDWTHSRLLFTHVTQPKELVRSETAEQMARRIKRHETSGKIYTVRSPSNATGGIASNASQLPREEPKQSLLNVIKRT